jgi:hypothetical protein
MSAHTLASNPRTEILGSLKKAIVTVTGSASYDTGGSTLDLSSIFPSKVYGARVIAVTPHASDKYREAYIAGSSNNPATGKIKLRNLATVTTGTPGSVDEVASTTDLSGTTFTLEVTGL